MAIWVVFVCKLLWLSCTWPNFDVFTSFPILFRGEKWEMNMDLSTSRWELEDWDTYTAVFTRGGMLQQLPCIPQSINSGSEGGGVDQPLACLLPSLPWACPTCAGCIICYQTTPQPSREHFWLPSVHLLRSKSLCGWAVQGSVGNTPHSPLFPTTLAKACWNWTISTTFWLGPSNSGNCQERTLGLCRASLVLHEANSSSG